MSGDSELRPQFVKDVPEVLESGILYVSPSYGAMLHLCACGCGAEVSTPLSPVEWKFTFDGETISVSPSVGSWDLPCRSHYVIRRNAVMWAGQWSEEQIAAGRAREMREKQDHYGTSADVPGIGVHYPLDTEKPDRSIWHRLMGRLAFWR